MFGEHVAPAAHHQRGVFGFHREGAKRGDVRTGQDELVVRGEALDGGQHVQVEVRFQDCLPEGGTLTPDQDGRHQAGTLAARNPEAAH